MTDSKREARVITHVFNVGGFFGEPVPMIEKEFYDSLLKENQELRDEERKMLARLHRQSAIMAEKDAEIARLREEIIQIIDKSGIEDIYNWGDPLRKIRKALARADGNEGV